MEQHKGCHCDSMKTQSHKLLNDKNKKLKQTQTLSLRGWWTTFEWISDESIRGLNH